MVLDATIVNIALPSAQQDLHFSDDDRQWVVTAYALAFGSLLLLGGRVADLFGRKWTFITGLLGFAGASAVGGAAPSFGVLVMRSGVAGRVRCHARACRAFPADHDVHRARGTQQGVRHLRCIAGMGGAIGLLLGGALTEALGWRWCLYVSMLFAVPAAIAGSRLLHHVPAATGRGLTSPAR